jgi:mxaJ protein
MNLRSPVLILLAAWLTGSCSHAQRTLRACVDPNNLPFSNRAGEGFENRLSALIASDLNARLEYVWWAQRRGFVRNTLKAGLCDLWPGVASTVDMVSTSRPYYRSTYVFLTRARDDLRGLTLDDPRLQRLRIGVQIIGDDGNNIPPAEALARRHIIANVRGYTLYGDYSRPNPPAAIIDAVARGEVDIAMVWGPLAGYFAARSPVPLRLEPVTPWLDDDRLPMAYDISVGVRRGDTQFLRQIDGVLTRRSREIRLLLGRYHIPLAQQ